MGLYRFLASDRELKEYDGTMKIVIENDYEKVAPYTSKKNFAQIEFNYNESSVNDLIAYIKEHLKICPRIELWNTNIGNTKDAIIRKCSKNILNKEYIKELWGKDKFEQPECLVVYNS